MEKAKEKMSKKKRVLIIIACVFGSIIIAAAAFVLYYGRFWWGWGTEEARPPYTGKYENKLDSFAEVKELYPDKDLVAGLEKIDLDYMYVRLSYDGEEYTGDYSDVDEWYSLSFFGCSKPNETETIYLFCLFKDGLEEYTQKNFDEGDIQYSAIGGVEIQTVYVKGEEMHSHSVFNHGGVIYYLHISFGENPAVEPSEYTAEFLSGLLCA